MRIEQAIYGDQDVGGYRFLARSEGFPDAWEALAEQVCTGFGNRPAGVVCPAAVFARPFGSRHIAVVQVADQGRDDAGRPGALAFRLLIVPRGLYADLGGDPFLIADQFLPDWSARGVLPTLEWTAGPPAPRTAAQLRRVLDVPADRTATLLGGVQVLIDGGRLVFERSSPDPEMIRDLWALLPNSTRSELWPATFAFGNAHRFHVLVTPSATGPEFEYHVNGAKAGDYPEGRYEFAIQKAVEDGDARELANLLGRRSRSQTMRLGIILLLLFLIVPPLVLNLPLGPRPRPRAEPPAAKEKPADPEMLKLPPASDFASLTEEQRGRFVDRLSSLARRLKVDLPPGTSDASLTADLAALDRAIMERSGKKPTRDPGPLTDLGPTERQLRAILWKYGAAGHDDRRLNPIEMIDRLERKLADAGVLKEAAGD